MNERSELCFFENIALWQKNIALWENDEYSENYEDSEKHEYSDKNNFKTILNMEMQQFTQIITHASIYTVCIIKTILYLYTIHIWLCSFNVFLII